jgi:hypothetical protein
MSTWTDEETRQLVILWSTSSAAQVARYLQRSRAAVCRKAQRLRLDGVALPRGDVAKHFEVPPRKPRPPRARPKPRMILPPPPPPLPVDDSLAMQPCSLLELDHTRCHWPLGPVNETTTLFCGGATVPGRSYCRFHMQTSKS